MTIKSIGYVAIAAYVWRAKPRRVIFRVNIFGSNLEALAGMTGRSLRAALNQRFAEFHNLLGERNEKLQKHIHLLPLRRRGL